MILQRDIMYGQTGAVYNIQHGCFCEYVDKLRTNTVSTYVRACQTMVQQQTDKGYLS